VQSFRFLSLQLGHLIIKAGSLYNVPMFFVGLIYIVDVALILNLLTIFFEKKVIK
jgi:ABC-type nitrate/sulfonate/bicarbonate transport system permease component